MHPHPAPLRALRAAALLTLPSLPLLAAPPAPLTPPPSSYLVVAKASTLADPAWREVVQALQRKHQGALATYQSSVAEVLAPLQQAFPRHTCFVTPPAEATRAFVSQVHQLTRTLDDDIYTDTQWGILTGYNAANALAIAQESAPLTIHKVASGTQFALDMVEDGLWYDELVPHKMVRKTNGGSPETRSVPQDTTKALVDTLNDYRPDCFLTSGHATERNWQIGFAYPNGYFLSQHGQLFGSDTQKNRFNVTSPNPKVYLAIGNCLMAHIDDPEAMALAWMHSAAVRQMIGYTVTTWFGYAGWGCLDYFIEQPGRYTLAESFLANHHALIHLLNTAPSPGLLHDRDVLAFYGDPLWEARLADRPKAWEQSLTQQDGTYTFSITPQRGTASFAPIDTNGSQRGGRPFIAFFPKRLHHIEIVSGGDLHPVIADDFILVPNPKTCDPTRPYQVVFKAREP